MLGEHRIDRKQWLGGAHLLQCRLRWEENRIPLITRPKDQFPLEIIAGFQKGSFFRLVYLSWFNDLYRLLEILHCRFIHNSEQVFIRGQKFEDDDYVIQVTNCARLSVGAVGLPVGCLPAKFKIIIQKQAKVRFGTLTLHDYTKMNSSNQKSNQNYCYLMVFISMRFVSTW